jgi:hypothetical protein
MSEHKTLAEALSAAQGELTNVGEDGRGNFGKYMTLPALINAVRPVLAAHGLSWSALPSIADSGEPSMRYQLLHASGESLGGEMALLMTKRDAQSQGSALTYGRRYALAAVLNIGADEDDDGTAASRPAQRSAPAQSSRPVPEVALLDSKTVAELIKVIDETEPPNEPLRQKMLDLGATDVPETMVRDSDGAINQTPLKKLKPEQAQALVRWLVSDDEPAVTA